MRNHNIQNDYLVRFPLEHPLGELIFTNIVLLATPSSANSARGKRTGDSRGVKGREGSRGSRSRAVSAPLRSALRRAAGPTGTGVGILQLGPTYIALRNITGQGPSLIKAKSSVANFNIKKGNEIACQTTLRRANLLNFYLNLF